MALQRFLVVGLGSTGYSCARFLYERGYEVAVTDNRDIPPYLTALRNEYPDIAVFAGGFNADAFTNAECIVVSPGVSVREPLIAEARARGTEIIGDIELFARYVTQPVIAITGSNGKSTVTTLLGEMAEASGVASRVGGNIGVPALDLLDADSAELYVLELSSFQLETTKSLDARASAILNISEDHMDRYSSMAEYSAAKARVYHGSGTLVVNLDDERVMNIVSMVAQGREIIGFTLHKPDEGQFGICRESETTWLCYGNEKLINTSELKIYGLHNMANALAALALGSAAGLKMETMLNALKRFAGLAHRCEWIATINEVKWFNDSKATNVGAALASISGVEADRLVLIAGGQGKGQDFTPLRDAVSKHVRIVILLGEDADRIEQALDGTDVEIVRVDSMRAAVSYASEIALPGEAVLLSPACASFDMFSGFEHRGRVFAELVRELA